MTATIHPSPVLLTGEAPERAAAVRADRVHHERLSTAVWALAAALLGAAAAAGTVGLIVQNVVLPMHI